MKTLRLKLYNGPIMSMNKAQFLRKMIGVSRKFMSIRITDHHFLRILFYGKQGCEIV